MARTKLQLPAKFQFKTEIQIRIGDINYGGHLGNDSVLSIIHEARIQFLQSLGYTEFDIEGAGIMMTDAIIMYTSEGFYGDVLIVEASIIDIQSASCDFIFQLTNKTTNEEVARVKTGIVFLNRDTRKIAPVPDAFLKRIKVI